MYKYVNDKFDCEYSQPLPTQDSYTEEELPIEEIEVREMVEAWYQSGYIRVYGANDESTSGGKMAQPLRTRQTEERLTKLETTLTHVLKHRSYQAAFQRLLTTLEPSPVKERLNYLLNKVKKQAIRH